MVTYQLRPMSFGEILDGALTVLRQHFGLFFSLADVVASYHYLNFGIAPMYELNWFAGYFFSMGPLGFTLFLFIEWMILWFALFALFSILKEALRQMSKVLAWVRVWN